MPAVGYIELTLKITREDDGYVAVCEELGVSTCDDSLDQLVEELQALITQHLNSLERNGIRARFFRERGIHIHKTRAAIRRSSRPLPVRTGEIVTRLTERIPALAGA